MLTMDVFKGDAFSLVEMIAALVRVPYKPSLLGQMGIFDDVPLRTETLFIEQRNNTLALIPTSQRGQPLDQAAKDGRDVRAFITRRIAKADQLRASELQNIRAFGTTTELEQAQTEVMRKFTKLRRDADLTHENMRIGAIKGIVTDADGSTLDNWFTNWTEAQPAEIDFALGTATTNVRGKCMAVRRAMRKASKGAWIDGVTECHALVGDDFYDALIGHDKVRDTFLNWEAAADLRNAKEWQAFVFGGIAWHNYRSTDNFDKDATSGTASVGVHPDKAHFFPVNAPGVFQRALSPGESFDYLNMPGQEYYPLIIPDEKRNMYVELELYSYPLYVCTTPLMLQRAKRA
jgi:hypothetical protein